MYEDDVFLACITISFDVSVFELFTPISVGARLVIMPDYMHADGFQQAELIKSCGATVINGTPSSFKLLLYAGWEGDPGVRGSIGGESMSQELVAELLPKFKEFWNLYGPTETTVFSLAHRIESVGTVPIGKPIGNTEVYIVDSRSQLVPVGVLGERLRQSARQSSSHPSVKSNRTSHICSP